MIKNLPPYKISISGYRLNLIFLEEGGRGEFLIYFYSRKIGIYIFAGEEMEEWWAKRDAESDICIRD